MRKFANKAVGQRTIGRSLPVVSIILMLLIVAACLCGGLFGALFGAEEPTYMDLQNCNVAPNREFWFGTDSMGRDIFAMIWGGGLVSLFVGFMSTVVSSLIAVVVGTISANVPRRIDSIIMRFVEILMSVPSILVIIFVQAVLGKANVLTLSLVIGLTSWFSIAKIVRTEVLQIKNSEYVLAAKCMGAGFWHVLYKHYFPNFVSSIMYMVVMNVRNAIITEATLSFMGIGLPLEIISWGSMLSLAENALTTGSAWIIIIPGVFLVVTLVCITNIGNYLREKYNRKERVI